MFKPKKILLASAVMAFVQLAHAQPSEPQAKIAQASPTVTMPAPSAGPATDASAERMTNASGASDAAAPSGATPKYSNDPFVQRREARHQAKQEYKAEKRTAKEEFRQDKRAARQEYREDKRQADAELRGARDAGNTQPPHGTLQSPSSGR
jgi:hypothetical protein